MKIVARVGFEPATFMPRLDNNPKPLF